MWTSLIAEADLPDIDETCFPSREVVDELVEGYLSTIAEPRRARALIVRRPPSCLCAADRAVAGPRDV